MTDPPLRRLHKRTLELYTFWMALLRKTLSDQTDGGQCSPSYKNYTIFYDSSVPWVKTKVWHPPGVFRWQIDGENDHPHSQRLRRHAQEFLGQVQHTNEQCHNTLLMLPEPLETELLYGTSSLFPPATSNY